MLKKKVEKQNYLATEKNKINLFYIVFIKYFRIEVTAARFQNGSGSKEIEPKPISSLRTLKKFNK